jgi:hypothetical protein
MVAIEMFLQPLSRAGSHGINAQHQTSAFKSIPASKNTRSSVIRQSKGIRHEPTITQANNPIRAYEVAGNQSSP